MRLAPREVPPIFAVGLLLMFLVVLSFGLFWGYARALGLPAYVNLPIYPWMASNFLAGRLDLPQFSSSTWDLIPFQGKLYGYWPPLPALIMMPLVWWRGAEQFPQRTLGCGLGALNVGLFFLLAWRLRPVGTEAVSAPRALWRAAGLALSLGWGSSNLTFAVMANHWFFGQLVASVPLLGSLILALDWGPRRSLAFAGAALLLAMSVLARQHLALAFPLWGYLAVRGDTAFQSFEQPGWIRRLFRLRPGAWVRLGMLAGALLAAQTVLLTYNKLRFGSIWDNGLSHQTHDPRVQEDFDRWGNFDAHYIPRNMYVLLIRPPGAPWLDGFPSWIGFSVLAQMPLLFLLLRRGPARFRGLKGIAGAAALGVVIPIFMNIGPGHAQFGARYLFDVVPILALPLCLTAWEGPWRRVWILGGLSIAINLLGPLHSLQILRF